MPLLITLLHFINSFVFSITTYCSISVSKNVMTFPTMMKICDSKSAFIFFTHKKNYSYFHFTRYNETQKQHVIFPMMVILDLKGFSLIGVLIRSQFFRRF